MKNKKKLRIRRAVRYLVSLLGVYILMISVQGNIANPSGLPWEILIGVGVLLATGPSWWDLFFASEGEECE